MLGALCGPLLAAVVDRLPRKLPVLAADAAPVPVRRRVTISAAAAALFGAVGARFAGQWALPAYLVLVASLLVVSVIDLEHYVIPNRVVYPTMAVALPLLAAAAALGHEWPRFVHAVIGGAVAWTLLFLFHLVSPRGMGFGDVRLSFVLGLYLGWLGFSYVALGIFLGFLLGAVAGLALVVVRRRSRKEAIPFGPFLAAGALLAVLAGSPLLRWYGA